MIIHSDDGNSSLNFATSHMFQPFIWVKVNGRQGTGLLYLRDQFDILSLFTLAIGKYIKFSYNYSGHKF